MALDGYFRTLAAGDHSTAAGLVEWPRVGSTVWVSLPCCPQSIHPTRVEAVSEGTLVIATPQRPHVDPLAPLAEGTIVAIGWKLGVSSARVQARMLWASETNSVWGFSAASSVELVERREHDRYIWTQPVELLVDESGTAVAGMILDISEGGLRCSFPETFHPYAEQSFEIAFEMRGKQMLVSAELVWCTAPRDGKREVGVQFLTPGDEVGRRVREHTFALKFEQQLARSGEPRPFPG